MISNYFNITSAFITTSVALLCGSLLLLNSPDVQANFPPCDPTSRGKKSPPEFYRYPAVVKSTVELLTEPNAPRCDIKVLSSGTVVYVLLDSQRVNGWVLIGQHSEKRRGYVPRDSLRRISRSALPQTINKKQAEDANLKPRILQSNSTLLSQQRILQRLGYAPGPIDGILGQRTISATKQFQRDNNLTVDGIIGPNTRAALNSADKSNSSNGSLKDAQLKLKALGFDPGPIDGLPGPRTTAAIVQFQRSRNLVADGILGPITRRALVSG